MRLLDIQESCRRVGHTRLCSKYSGYSCWVDLCCSNLWDSAPQDIRFLFLLPTSEVYVFFCLCSPFVHLLIVQNDKICFSYSLRSLLFQWKKNDKASSLTCMAFLLASALLDLFCD